MPGLEDMTEFVAFGAHVSGGAFERWHDDWGALDNLYAGVFESSDLVGIIREQTDCEDVEVTQDGGGQGVVAQVRRRNQVLHWLRRYRGRHPAIHRRATC